MKTEAFAKNRTMRTGLILAVVALITLIALAFTFAKYVSEGTGSDNARVAKWGIGVDVKKELGLFSQAYKDGSATTTGDQSATVQSSNGENVVAPGTEREAQVAIVSVKGSAPEVMYDLDVNLTITDFTTSNPIDKSAIALLDQNPSWTWNVTTPKGDKSVFQTHGELEKYIKDTFSKKAIAPNNLPGWLSPDSNNVIKVGWKWDFYVDASRDEVDTVIGNLAASGELAKMKVTLDISATQVQQTNTDQVVVAFDTQGGSMNPDSQIIDKGASATAPTVIPYKQGYTFEGWYTDKTFIADKQWDFSNPVNSSMILYAKFIPAGATYTVSFECRGCLKDLDPIENVPYGTLYSISGNRFILNGQEYSVSPDSDHYGTAQWDQPASGTIKGDTKFTVTFAEKAKWQDLDFAPSPLTFEKSDTEVTKEFNAASCSSGSPTFNYFISIDESSKVELDIPFLRELFKSPANADFSIKNKELNQLTMAGGVEEGTYTVKIKAVAQADETHKDTDISATCEVTVNSAKKSLTVKDPQGRTFICHPLCDPTKEVRIPDSVTFFDANDNEIQRGSDGYTMSDLKDAVSYINTDETQTFNAVRFVEGEAPNFGYTQVFGDHSTIIEDYYATKEDLTIEIKSYLCDGQDDSAIQILFYDMSATDRIPKIDSISVKDIAEVYLSDVDNYRFLSGELNPANPNNPQTNTITKSNGRAWRWTTNQYIIPVGTLSYIFKHTFN